MCQCSFPVFEGLFPMPHDKRILDLLWDFATWHAYAKLRLHTDDTLWSFRELTIELGNSMRDFKDNTCSAYVTNELPKEIAARGRREAATTARRNERRALRAQKEAEKGDTESSGKKKKKKDEPKEKFFNINTPKWHFHGDYADSIDWVGTTDVTSTQRVCDDGFPRNRHTDFK